MGERIMKNFVSVLSVGLALALSFGCSSSSDGGGGGAAGSGGAAAGAGGTAGSSAGAAGSSSTGTYQGSCDEPSKDECDDDYCSGNSCATLLADAKTQCSGTWSETKCKDGAPCKCAISAMGWTKETSFYADDCAKVKSTCTQVGGKYTGQ